MPPPLLPSPARLPALPVLVLPPARLPPLPPLLLLLLRLPLSPPLLVLGPEAASSHQGNRSSAADTRGVPRCPLPLPAAPPAWPLHQRAATAGTAAAGKHGCTACLRTERGLANEGQAPHSCSGNPGRPARRRRRAAPPTLLPRVPGGKCRCGPHRINDRFQSASIAQRLGVGSSTRTVSSTRRRSRRLGGW